MLDPQYIVCCSFCGAPIGAYVQVGRETWLQIGCVKLYALHGRCACCGGEYHYAASDKLLERLIERTGRKRALEK
jgi:hypothetical protein